jgi:hypothetical protein
MTRRGLSFGTGSALAPYQSMTYRDAILLCRSIDTQAPCRISHDNENDVIRNTAVLKLLLDTAGFTLQKTNVPYQVQIAFARKRNLLTKDFANRTWFTRAEGMMLAQNILKYKAAKNH